MVCHSPLSGLSVPIRRALRDQMVGIERTSDGHWLPVLWASSAQIESLNLGTQCQ